jgi:hypothetical protein
MNVYKELNRVLKQKFVQPLFNHYSNIIASVPIASVSITGVPAGKSRGKIA